MGRGSESREMSKGTLERRTLKGMGKTARKSVVRNI